MPQAMTELPRQAGLGLKPEHYAAILADHPQVGFFEVHAENYMGDGGPLTAISRPYARTIRCRSTASACRSAASGRWTRRISAG